MFAPPPTRNGILTIETTYLQMVARPPAGPGSSPAGATGVEARRPTVSFYRYLYNTVGRDYLWFLRRQMSDDELAAIIHDPAVAVFVLYQDGVPAGFAELDRRAMPAVELAYFGLIPEFIGQGLGGYFLRWAIHRAWDDGPECLLVHTNTLDHPAALPNYLKQGFAIVETRTQRIQDPRAGGEFL